MDLGSRRATTRRQPGDLTIAFVSDLHTEFHADEGRTLAAELDLTGVDVLVLAGDIAVGEALGPVLDLFYARFPDADVLFVSGNHEHYDTPRDVVVRIVAENSITTVQHELRLQRCATPEGIVAENSSREENAEAQLRVLNARGHRRGEQPRGDPWGGRPISVLNARGHRRGEQS